MLGQNRLHDDFEVKGYWWIPERSDKKVPGILHYRGGDMRVELMGSLTPPVPNVVAVPRSTRVRVIYGSTEYGQACTLLDSIEISTSILLPAAGDADVNAEVLPDLLFMGDFLRYFDELRFGMVSSHFTYLEDWLGLQPFDAGQVLHGIFPTDQPYNVEVAYNWREIVEILGPSRGCTIKIVSRVVEDREEFKYLTLRHEPFVLIEPTGQPLDYWSYWNLLSDCRNLLTILMGIPVYPTYIQASEAKGLNGEGPPSPTIEVYHRSRYPKPIRRTTWRWDMPVPFASIANDRAGVVFSNWLDHAEDLSPVYSLLAETYYDPLMKVEMEFLRLAQALEILHRRLYDGVNFDGQALQQLKNAVKAGLSPGFGEELKDEMVGRLNYINEYSFAQRLRALLDGLGEDLRRDIAGNSLDTFVRTVVDTRNHLVHYGKRSKYALEGFEAFSDTNRRLRALLLVLLCGLIGIREDAATEHIVEVLRLHGNGR